MLQVPEVKHGTRTEGGSCNVKLLHGRHAHHASRAQGLPLVPLRFPLRLRQLTTAACHLAQEHDSCSLPEKDLTA